MPVRPIDALLPRASRAFGSKARNLAALVRAGFPVPAAHALSSVAALEHYDNALPRDLRPDRLFAQSAISPAAIAEARQRVLTTPLQPDLVHALARTFTTLRAASVESLAVRSSSTAEDLGAASAAGLHTTVLNVRNLDELLDAVRLCFANVFSPRALNYLHALGIDNIGAMGIVIQALVPADVAGVLFTVNPLSGDPDEIVIDAAFGLGTAVTDGQCTPDTFRIEKHTGWVRDRVIGDKRVRVVAPASGGLRAEAVPPHQAQQQALDEHMLAQLVALARRVEEHFGDPRDVEFAIAGDHIYLLQARPVTAAVVAGTSRARVRRRKRLSTDAANVVWSNLNVGEALPGVATPLTWSVLSEFSELGFTRAFAALGCKVPKDARLVGSFRGRIYLNVSELSAIARQVPGLRPSVVLAFGGGGEEIERLEGEARNGGSSSFLLRLPLTVARFTRSHLGFARRVQAFERGFEGERARIEAMDLRILSSTALDATLSDVHRMLDDAGTTLLTAYGGLLAALVPLRAALGLLQGERAPRTQQALISAIEGVESAGPGEAIMRVAAAFGRDPEAKRRLLERPLQAVHELPPGEARGAVEDMLRRYGHRGVREAELSEPRWREQPRLLFDALRLHVAHASQAPELALQRRIAEVRAAGDAALHSLPPATRPALKALLSVVRDYLRLRERLRSHVVQVLGLFRLIALDASRRIMVREPAAGPDAAFFLTLSELHALLRGETSSVAGLLRLRRAQYARDRSLPDPPDTFVGYPTTVSPSDASTTELLRGLGASSGAVEGPVRVLRSSDEISSVVPGDILVVPAADVGWSPVFVVAGGLITDVGGPLSHACVVAREYGLPAVVNVRDATRALQTGERVRVDGDTGIVQRLTLGGAVPALRGGTSDAAP